MNDERETVITMAQICHVCMYQQSYVSYVMWSLSIYPIWDI